MSKQPLKAIAGAPDRPLRIGDIEIPCYVLEDETRVLSQRGLQSGIDLGTGGSMRTGAPRMTRFVASLGDKGLDVKDLMARITSPIEFQPPGGGRTAYGYPAKLLVDICRAVLSARRAGILQKQQAHIADRCEILTMGLANVAIAALVDEATGYQEIRTKRALAEILEKFIAKELQAWTKTFPLEFYTEIARLKGWPASYNLKRPSVVGHYTNDIVYARIAPEVLAELKRRNPTISPGRRRHKHTQWFTPEFGHPKLKEHLASVRALMRAASNWTRFKGSLNRAFPILNTNVELPLEYDE